MNEQDLVFPKAPNVAMALSDINETLCTLLEAIATLNANVVALAGATQEKARSAYQEASPTPPTWTTLLEKWVKTDECKAIAAQNRLTIRLALSKVGISKAGNGHFKSAGGVLQRCGFMRVTTPPLPEGEAAIYVMDTRPR